MAILKVSVRVDEVLARPGHHHMDVSDHTGIVAASQQNWWQKLDRSSFPIALHMASDVSRRFLTLVCVSMLAR
jgi:hypothetical protein